LYGSIFPLVACPIRVPITLPAMCSFVLPDYIKPRLTAVCSAMVRDGIAVASQCWRAAELIFQAA
jgi:hypothetical protein